MLLLFLFATLHRLHCLSHYVHGTYMIALVLGQRGTLIAGGMATFKMHAQSILMYSLAELIYFYAPFILVIYNMSIIYTSVTYLT